MKSRFSVWSTWLLSATLFAAVAVLSSCASSTTTQSNTAHADPDLDSNASTVPKLVRVVEITFAGEKELGVVYRMLADGRIFRVEPDAQPQYIADRVDPNNGEFVFTFDSGWMGWVGVTSDGNVWTLDTSGNRSGQQPIGSAKEVLSEALAF